ncbi:MAG: hypothetical protein ACKVOW_12690 [Chitinophagaceae bacterium]
MFNSISWREYITLIIIALAIYYTFVGYKYFRWEILSLIGIKKIENEQISIPAVSNFKKQFVAENHNYYLPKPLLEVDISPLVQAFTDEVQAYINEADAKALKPELLFSVQLIAAKYNALKEADCKQELLQFVFAAINNKFPRLIEKEDAGQLWV